MKTVAWKSLVLAGLALGSAQATMAYTPAGPNSAGPGATNLVVFGQSFPCTAVFAINVTTIGAAEVTGASFSTPGSAVCPFMVASGFPWKIAPATIVGIGVYEEIVSGITVTVKQANGTVVATCTGSVTARIDQRVNPHRLTYSGTLTTTAPVSGQPCYVNTQPSATLPTVLTAP